MSEKIAQLKQNLEKSRATLNEAFDLIGDKGDEQIYSEGAQWTLNQLAVHLALADIGHNRMVMSYANDQEFIPADYDIERYNKRSVEKKADMTLKQSRASLKKSREEFITWLDAVEDDAILQKTGRHATLQIMTLEQIIGVMCYHEEAHAKDMMTMLND
ncbi:MAG: hypothetical protein Phog2KO_09690 [Phototrophicaceae bacterium]